MACPAASSFPGLPLARSGARAVSRQGPRRSHGWDSRPQLHGPGPNYTRKSAANSGPLRRRQVFMPDARRR
jgi:hypothetical protein